MTGGLMEHMPYWRDCNVLRPIKVLLSALILTLYLAIPLFITFITFYY